MAIIGLYDIDMWHRGQSAPNLELMQIYNYFYSRNNRVIMLKPNDNLTKFQKIYYFKEKPNIALPNSLELNLDKGELIGYGFYEVLPTLKTEITTLAPASVPYDIYSYKLFVPKGYDTLKKNSIVRVETNNFGGLNLKSRYIYITDANFLYTAGAEEFVIDNKRTHDFLFYNPLYAKDEETFHKFNRFTNIFNRRIIIDFPYDENFFYENLSNACFILKKKENETDLNYLIRLVKSILIYKNKNVYFSQRLAGTTSIEKQIYMWGKSPKQLSYLEFYKDNSQIQKEINTYPTELRLLLKQNPLTITHSIDLQSSL